MITIDWPNKIINVPRTDMSLVQASPEVRELNLNDFRLALKDLEDDPEGIVYLRTHRHNTEVTLSGIIYARIFEIINDYTVTFEAGTYAINAVGANSNLSDVTNPSAGVTLNTANSAGLISTASIEFASFQNVVTLDVVNGVTGTAYPTGTPQRPVNNVPDAVLIAERRGITAIKVVGDYTFDTGDNLEDYIIQGENTARSTLTFNPGSNVLNADIRSASIIGTFDGPTTFTDCSIHDINTVRGDFRRCVLNGVIVLVGGGQSSFYNCSDGLVAGGVTPAIDMGGVDKNLAIRDYVGDIEIRNSTAANNIAELNINKGGNIYLASSITAGIFRLTGSLKLIDNSTSVTSLDITQIIFPDQLQLAAFGGQVRININNGTAGTRFPQGTHQFPVNNLADAITIATARGLDNFLVDGTLVVTNTDISNFTFIGENRLSAVVVLSGTGNTTNNTTFERMILTGRVNGHVYCDEVALQTISNIGSDVFPTIFRNCILRADVGATPALQMRNDVTNQTNTHWIDCVSGVPGIETSTIDVNDSDAPIAFRRYSGGLVMLNYTAGQDSTFQIAGDGGKLFVGPSNTSGTIRFRGAGVIEDTSGVGFTIDIEDAIGEKVVELHQLQGLDIDSPMTVSDTARNAGNIDLDISEAGGTVTVTRQ